MPDGDVRHAPYPEYRESGLPWLGPIPSHWEVQRNGRLFAQRVEIGFPELPILEVSLKTGVRVRDMNNGGRKQVMSDRAKYKRALKGDIAYNMMRMWQGAVGVPPVDGLVSPAYVVARPFSDVESRYFSYLFRTGAYMGEVDGYSRGIVKDRNRLYWEDFKRMPSCVPPLDEQRRIVNFLDWHGRLVQRYVRNRRELIDALNDRKQAIIDRLVTRGLDTSKGRRPSAVAWLGEVPEHWVIKPLKRWAYVNRLALPETTDPDYEFHYLDIGAVGIGLLLEQPVRMLFRNAPSRARRILRRGDTIISTVRTYLKAVYFVADEVANWVASTGFAVLTPRDAVFPEFLSRVVLSSAFIDRVTAHSIGIAYPAIAESRLAAFHIAMPPSVAEQAQIVKRVERDTREIDQALERTRREIDLVRDYRERLISEVVTGLVSVQKLATSGDYFGAAGDDALGDVMSNADFDDLGDEGIIEEVADANE